MRKSAEISPCGRYRWSLRRSWTSPLVDDLGVVTFVMLNPSTADASIDDPTIRRCIGFAKSWGYGALSVKNLFALRSTEPKALLMADISPSGGHRGDAELLASLAADRIVVAWGAWVPFGRDVWFLDAASKAGRELFCLGMTKGGAPRHPLYVRGDAKPTAFKQADAAGAER